ncbi:XK-related protein 8 [Mixophyes fleayi]|uniref:XK-related protein 8 n=1 Tax=Mixophyes fleayi TaxID=3061075 RepID=UPI003F4DE89E
MPGCIPPRYRLLDLLLALGGTVAFLGDLGSDVWSAVRYYQAGDTLWAALYFGFYVFSSAVLQVLSWGWFWVDRLDWPAADLPSSELNAMNGNGAKYHDHATLPGCASAETAACAVDAALLAGGISKTFPEDMTSCHTSAEYSPRANVETTGLPEAEMPPSAGTEEIINGDNCPVLPNTWDKSPEDHSAETGIFCKPGAEHTKGAESEHFMEHFYTSRIILWPSCLLIPHILQLGYILRCIHSLEVGFAAYRNPKSSQYQDYAYFLTHDISMMRLVETFLENTPQLILVLYIIIQRDTIHTFQYVSISISFICISWAILDYHQSLRLFLKEKEKLGTLSSIIYYLWNFCLISSRILCITLFTVIFQWWIALHFLGLWLAFFIWAYVQKTDFMKNKVLEFFYRATVAVILYFSWFNIADGRTIYRCIIYYIFITTDSMLLFWSWKYLKFPSILEEYETHLLVIVIVLLTMGLLIRLLYYTLVHPNVRRETKQYYDEPDGISGGGTYRMFRSTVKTVRQNNRMLHLAKQIC